uniref:Uncharacterized protein n=1 Tax=Lotharella globosa TaxID=91324 RepID=A0A7S4E0V1_9EUKA|mmetsp:Transcript_32007/g.61873  ORF Transcript_32007/g.61873 Transcript_32007/m.61873 type:complete len:239 (+) Transcript_32007:3-719(+)
MASGTDVKLACSYTLWCMSKDGGFKEDAFAEGIKKIGDFDTVNGFWSYYKFLTPPNDLRPKRAIDYHCFRTGIKPIWEDPANENGGEWVLRLKKGAASRVWEDLLLAVLSGAFGDDDEICGVVVSAKALEDKITIWNKTGADKDKVMMILAALQKILGITNAAAFEYLAHSNKIKQLQMNKNDQSNAGRGGHRQRKSSGKHSRRSSHAHSNGHHHSGGQLHNKPNGEQSRIAAVEQKQ